MKTSQIIGFVALASFVGTPVYAESLWSVQGGLTSVMPNVKSGQLTAPAPSNTTADVGSDTQATMQINYALSPHWSVAVPLGFGFRHEMKGTGAIEGVGVIGNVKALPITVFGRYHFNPTSTTARVYGALGLSYVQFSDANGSATLNGINPINPPGGKTTLKVDSQSAWSIGLGVQAPLKDGWYADLFVGQMKLKTTTHLSTGQSMEAQLDPTTFTFAIGRSF